MDFAQMMTLLIVSQRHFMRGPSNVYRVIWDCIGVILTPCNLFYLTDICQTLIDKFDRCQGPKTVRKSRCAGPRAAQRLFNVLPLFLLYCVNNKHHIVPFTCVHYSLPCLSYSDRYNLQQQSIYHLGTFGYHLESFGIIWSTFGLIWSTFGQ